MKPAIIGIGCAAIVLLVWSGYRKRQGSEQSEAPEELTLQQLVFIRQAPQRADLLRSITSSNGNRMSRLYNALVPEVLCKDLIRVGKVDDGGKWVCNPHMMKKEKCSIYSLGLHNEMSFDTEIQEFNERNCKIYGYDMGEQSSRTKHDYAEINGKTKVVKIAPITNLSAVPPEFAIADLVYENGDTEIEMLKMDVERAEHLSLPPFLERFQPCQIFLEMHGNAFDMRNLLVKIASFGYYLFSYEINGVALTLCEYAFIHSSCMERYNATLIAPYIKNAGSSAIFK